MTNPAYVLGHSSFEFERLARQERLIGRVTREYFQAAGITPGMHVLDVGSGTGVVAFHAAELVGSSGQVIGTDLAPAAIAAASEAASSRGLAQGVSWLIEHGRVQDPNLQTTRVQSWRVGENTTAKKGPMGQSEIKTR